MAILDGTPQAILAGTWNIQVEMALQVRRLLEYATGALAPILLDGGSYR